MPRPSRSRSDAAPAPRRAGVILLAVWLGCIVSAGCGKRSPEPYRPLQIGERIPSFELESLEGGVVTSAELEGSPVVLAFWATWCQPCLKEIPVFMELEAASKARIIAIALDEEGAQRVAPFVERHNIGYSVLLGDQKIFEQFSGFAIPYTLVLDPELRILNIYRGPTTRARIEEDLERIGTA